MKKSSVRRGIYQHFKKEKNGEKMLYEVLGVAEHTETEERLVIYRALYGKHVLYARPETMFLDKVTKPELNYKGPRFIFMQELE